MNERLGKNVLLYQEAFSRKMFETLEAYCFQLVLTLFDISYLSMLVHRMSKSVDIHRVVHHPYCLQGHSCLLQSNDKQCKIATRSEFDVYRMIGKQCAFCCPLLYLLVPYAHCFSCCLPCGIFRLINIFSNW